MEWTERHDTFLAREVLVSEPYRFKKGSVDKGKAWSAIADRLNSSLDLLFRVSQRSVRERFALIQDKFIKKNHRDERSSGTSIIMTEIDQLIEEVTEKEKAAEETRGVNENRGKIEADRAKAEEARKRAMERMGQTKRRLSEDGEDCRKHRRSGNDTLAFLRERSAIDRALKEKELDLKKLEMEEQARRAQQAQQQMLEMMQMMQQQQAQMQATQDMLLQQQQQQGQALLAVIEKLSK